MPCGPRRQDLLELHHNAAVRLRTPLPDTLAAAARLGAAAALADLEPTHLVRAAVLLLWPARGQARGPRRRAQPTPAPSRARAGCSRAGGRGGRGWRRGPASAPGARCAAGAGAAAPRPPPGLCGCRCRAGRPARAGPAMGSGRAPRATSAVGPLL